MTHKSAWSYCYRFVWLLVIVAFAPAAIAVEIPCIEGVTAGFCAPPEVHDWWCSGNNTDVSSDPQCKPEGSTAAGGHCLIDDDVANAIMTNEVTLRGSCSAPSYSWNGTGAYSSTGYALGLLYSHTRLATIDLTYPGIIYNQCPTGIAGHFGVQANCARDILCPSGYSEYGSSNDCFRTPGEIPFDFGKNKGSCTNCSGGTSFTLNPINIGAANKFVSEVDIPAGPGGLEFRRSYNSREPDPSTVIGTGWQHNYNSRVVVDSVSSPSQFASLASAFRSDGRVIRFYIATGSTTWATDTDITDRFATLLDGSGNVIGYQLTEGTTDRVETYDVNGRLTSIVDTRKSLTFSFAYDTSFRLYTVTDRSGRSIQFGYDIYGRITDVWQPDSALGSPSSPHWHYTYDSTSNLTSVTTPSGTTRTYAYENTSFPAALTGIIDENSNRYSTYSYDSQGRTLAENLWSGAGATLPVQQFTLAYPGSHVAQVTDPLGITHNLQFALIEGVSLLVSMTQPCYFCDRNVQSRTFDSSGFVDLVTDFNGNVTDHDYSGRGLETKRVDASTSTGSAKRTINTTWDSTFAVPTLRTTVDSLGTPETQTSWTYNARGQVTARCQADPTVSGATSYTCGSLTNAPTGVQQTTFTYCDTIGTGCPIVGLLLTVDGARTDVTDVTTYSYYQTTDISGCATTGGTCHYMGDLFEVTDAAGHVTSYISYDKDGRVTRIEDANGTYTDMTYHPRGWLLTRTIRVNADGSPNAGDFTTTFSYDNVGNVSQITQPDGAYLSYTYDAAHRLTDIKDNLNNSIHYTLDAAGNRTQEDTRDSPPVTGTLRRRLQRQYDSLNRLTQILNATPAAVQTYQNPPSPETPPAGVTWTDGYDGNGNAIYSVDGGLGAGTEQQYDPLNRLVKTLQDHTGLTTPTQDTTTQYGYDARDNLVSVTDPDNLPTTYTYDGLNNLTQLNSPDTGTTNYTYDAAGNRAAQVDAKSVTTTYHYDALNRLTGITYPTTSLNVTYYYDDPNATTGCSPSYPIGHLTRIIDSTGTTTYCYNRRGDMRAKTQTIGGTALTATYAYDLGDHISSITYPSGAIVTYGRDSLGRITSVTYQANATATVQTLVSNVTYYPFGPLQTITYGNGHSLTKTYDQDYAIDSIQSSLSSALQMDLTVDVLGNIVNAANTVPSSTPTQKYFYDPLYRLTSVTDGSNNPIDSFAYGKTGDRLSETTSAGTTSYGYSSPLTSHRLLSVGGVARSYDSNGNLQTNVNGTLYYDDRNRLSGINNVGTHSNGAKERINNYNGKGEMTIIQTGTVGSSLVTTLYFYDESGQLLGFYNVSGGVQQEYIYLDSTEIGMAYGGTLYYIETDHLGSPRAIIQPGSPDTLVWKWDFFGSAFGTNAPSPATVQLNQRFPGQLWNSQTGLHYNYFRDYEPGTGRYVESDPIGIRAGVDTYSYVNSKPFVKVDMRGLEGSNGIVPEQACKLLEKGYDPPDDKPCECQKKVVTDLCDCYHKYNWFWQIGELGACVQKAYLVKSKCVNGCLACGSSADGTGMYAP